MHPRGRRVRLNRCVTLVVDPAVNLPRRQATYEQRFFRRFLSAITPGATVYDVGANQGLYTVAAAQRAGEKGRVYAFEPAPASLQVLTRQISLNKVERIVNPVNSLVGSRCEPVLPFHIAPTAAGWASAAYRPPGTATILVNCVTIDSFALATGSVPGVIKIDVEGFELEVLRGAAETLRTHRPLIFCALHPQFLRMRGTSNADIVAFLRNCGYTARTLSGGGIRMSSTEAVLAPAETQL